ncbi:RNA polymerase sigma factor [Nesterenkonia sandarakina]|uniref:RNA polymerase sigma-70 factor (ECF subfamily) n=1 Tax=Nesterenkonia sandarakina TaxID=272918 RepID=A0A7Z0EBI7_9MICC|nr:RNA polymerase sigma factor [Nesterenkonia sandarakina]NYJ18085.1 RNA polymerase sigma-70 factor (ECF subfamily) [Nesterenkonia sandarakina]NYJ18160.1 RNA polymerase sigma-70 factor (ECF subfamily) [Nesterenkonia sandarakina]
MTHSRESPVETALRANSIDLLHYFERRTDRDAAADLMAETMLTAWQREKDHPEGTESSRMWLFGIARNVLKNSERGARRRHRLASKLRKLLHPDEASHSADDGVEVRDAIEQLDPALAELVRLIHWEGFSINDAGQILGLPSSTARGSYQRAKQQLREALEPGNSEAQHCPATLPHVDLNTFTGNERVTGID